ncbi:MAG: hypothetical protein ACKO7W_12435, partial [Elainella sp.]
DAALTRKQEFYETYGVEEYYLYDPDTNQLNGWLRQHNRLLPIDTMQDWVSPRLQIRFGGQFGGRRGNQVDRQTDNQPDELALYYPDGQKFLTSIELDRRAKVAEQRAIEAEAALERERQRAERLAERLRALGGLDEADPDDQL